MRSFAKLATLSAVALLTLTAQTATAQTWEAVPSGSSQMVYNTFFLNPNLGWIGGEGSLIRKTTDAGVTWTAQAPNTLNVADIQFLNPDTGWAVAGGGGAGAILKTTNGGTTWVKQRTDLSAVWGVHFVNPNVGWVSCAGGRVLKTTDGGTTWTSQTTNTSLDLRRVSFRNADTGWVAGLGVILRTTNGGTTWTPTLFATGSFNELQFVGDIGWAAGDIVVKSTNAGATWTTLPTGTSAVFSAVNFLNASAGYVAGSGGTLLFTSDGGTNWTPISTGTNAHIASLSFHAIGYGWLSGEAGILKKAVSTTPANLTYAANPAAYTLNMVIPSNTPFLQGETPLTFSVFPDLPAGLALNPSTGAITGTPSASVSSQYVVTVLNMYGSATATLDLSVGPPPSSLSYSPNPVIYAVNSAIPPHTPVITGRATKWSVSPALPEGLSMNAATGVVSGTPTAPSAAADYAVTATNTSGSSTNTTLNIAAWLKPANLAYSVNPASYPTGVAIAPNAPSLSGTSPMTYSVTPSLPAGLTLNATNGIISGTPQTAAAAASYSITASNAVGSSTTVLSLTVPTAIGAPAAKGPTFAFRAGRAARLSFAVPSGAEAARLEILDASGRTLWERRGVEGSSLEWEGSAAAGMAAGVYSLRLVWLDAARQPISTAKRTFVYAP